MIFPGKKRSPQTPRREQQAQGSVFFEAQTGLVRSSRPAVSNFHNYELPATDREWLEANVSKAEVGPNGFIYQREFIQQLTAKADAYRRKNA